MYTVIFNEAFKVLKRKTSVKVSERLESVTEIWEKNLRYNGNNDFLISCQVFDVSWDNMSLYRCTSSHYQLYNQP